MIYPHRMRLRGPWECTLPGASGPCRVNMPCTWAELRRHCGLERPGVDAASAAAVRLVRRFGYPGRIDAHERVWLILESVSGPARVVVNEHAVGQAVSGDAAFDVTGLLQARNHLLLESPSAAAGSPWTEVALEIRCTAYLEGLHVTGAADGTQHLAGRVMGHCDGPLEVYGIVDGAHVHYQTIVATAAGTPFQFQLPPGARHIRVDLVSVSTVWYAWEQMLH